MHHNLPTTPTEEVQPIPVSQSPEVVTVTEAAAIARINRKVISALCESGELAAVDLGIGSRRIWRIRRDSILELLAKQNGGPA